MNKTLPLIFSLFLAISLQIAAQNPGDTLVVQAFNYNSTTRDTVIDFTPVENQQFEKVIMLYSMRCKDGMVSNGTNRNRGCGEWDYSCNTYLTDSNHVDSLTATHPNYAISGFGGSTYSYVAQPTYRMHQMVQQNVMVNSTTSEDTATFGTGTVAQNSLLQTALGSGKSQMLLTASQLQAAGLQAGSIDALALFVQSAPQTARMFRVRVKTTTKTTIDPSNPDLTSFTEVFFQNKTFVSGINRVQFYTPFLWNGTDNLIVELTFTNAAATSAMHFLADSLAANAVIYTAGDATLKFDGSNYITATGYKGIAGSANRTIEAWVKTTGGEMDIAYFGSNVAGQKYRFWINGSGQLRTEVNSGYAVGTAVVNDGQWHHLAMVQNGSNTNQIAFYVDGVSDAISTVGSYAINTQPDWDVTVGRSIHNKYFVGHIADVRIWESALSQATIQDWRYRKIQANHPNFNQLALYYPLNDNNSSNIADQSGNARNGLVVNDAPWQTLTGINHFKGWSATALLPKLDLYQGVYNLTVSPDTVVDSIANFPNLVTQYQVFSKSGTLRHDSIGIINQNYFWLATADSLFDPQGNLVSTYSNTPSGSISISNLTYWQRFPSKFEIMSFVTPYGINLDLGIEGKTWLFDLTDFSPILNGKKRITMEWGGQWQEDIDIKFWCIVGTPPRDVLDIQQIWRVSKQAYTAINNDAAFEPRNVALLPNASGFKIRSAITGHGQEGEFIPRNHNLSINGSNVATWQVWKECGLNPVFPQGGTWIYDRAGWCPGMATDVHLLDATAQLSPGQTATIDYNMSVASGTSQYIVNHQLVSYGSPNFVLDAAVVDIINPTDNIAHQRSGFSMCTGPVVRIKNTGSTALSQLTISYWVNNAPAPQVFAWTGNLGFLEEAEVQLPVGNLWDGISGTTGNIFHVAVSQPNGSTDGYTHNNHMQIGFELPLVLPNNIYFRYRSNNAAAETDYYLYDEFGNQILSRTSFANNQNYYDTLNLANGCYSLVIEDSDDDGISFWANNDGGGSFSIYNMQLPFPIYTVQPDFGKAIRLDFTVNAPLDYEDLVVEKGMIVYPNPNNGQFVVEAKVDKPTMWQISVATLDGKAIYNHSHTESSALQTQVDLTSLSSGVYILRVASNQGVFVEKLTVID